jgi:hypothetical protein
MHVEQSKRTKPHIKLAIYGCSGSGKTFGALLLAFGLTGDWSKIVVVDTEVNSASLYNSLGPFNMVQIGPPFSPHRYEEALMLCANAEKEVIIIDSLSHEWNGDGGMKDILHFKEYEEGLRNHKYLLSQITKAPCHIICTIRSKKKIIARENGKAFLPLLIEIPVQQEGIEYAFMSVLKLNQHHKFLCEKDVTGVFSKSQDCPIEIDHGAFLKQWCDDQNSDESKLFPAA